MRPCLARGAASDGPGLVDIGPSGLSGEIDIGRYQAPGARAVRTGAAHRCAHRGLDAHLCSIDRASQPASICVHRTRQGCRTLCASRPRYTRPYKAKALYAVRVYVALYVVCVSRTHPRRSGAAGLDLCTPYKAYTDRSRDGAAHAAARMLSRPPSRRNKTEARCSNFALIALIAAKSFALIELPSSMLFPHRHHRGETEPSLAPPPGWTGSSRGARCGSGA